MRQVAKVILCATIVCAGGTAGADDMGVARKLEDNKLAKLADLPGCLTGAVEAGDPGTGGAVLVLEAKAGCVVPWHWHSAVEQVMVVSGRAKVEVREEGSAPTKRTVRAGGYAMLPGKSSHQFTCISACTMFVATDGAFDTHYIDASKAPSDAQGSKEIRTGEKPMGEMAMVRGLDEIKLAPLPVLPACVTAAPEHGDPTKGPSTIVFKAKAGCTIPWHWHTPTEQVMIVGGTARVEMRREGASPMTTLLRSGGFAMMPSHHIHQFTCTSACTAFVTSDAAFDIHYVDEHGREITRDTAMPRQARIAPKKRRGAN